MNFLSTALIKTTTTNALFSKTCNLVCSSTWLRKLYNPSSMGLDVYVNTREKTRQQFANSYDRFKSKMAEFSDEQSKHMIFTEDLKSMIHLVESDDDLGVILSMMRKFNSQNKELRFGSFIFGPVVMRMYYHLNKPVEALEAFKDEKLAGFFDQFISYQILMDLLFKNQMYNEMQETFQMIRDKQLQPLRYPKSVVVLYFAACYRLNTKEALDDVLKVWHEIKEHGQQQMRRAVTFAAALALKQGAAHVALEILSNEYNQNYVTVRNLKAWALADLGRPDDILPLLTGVLHLDDPNSSQKHTFFEEIMDPIKRAFSLCSDKEIVAEFQRAEKQLYAHNLVTKESLDEVLCSEIKLPPRNDTQQQRNQFLEGSYRIADHRQKNTLNRIGRSGGSQYRQSRPGLADMN